MPSQNGMVFSYAFLSLQNKGSAINKPDSTSMIIVNNDDNKPSSKNSVHYFIYLRSDLTAQRQITK
jgi:hypothetical protein